MINAGLILEGGGMRGVYTAGILEYFLHKGLEFKDCYGVSAGSCHASSFLSGQKGRAFDVAVKYLNDKRYCSLHSLFTTGDLFGAKMCYDIIPNELNQYDYEAFTRSNTKFFAVATNCETGEAEYLPVLEMKKGIKAVRASSSLPLVSRMVKIEGKFYLDGGIADSIPIQKSIDDGNMKNVIVLTQNRDYQKSPNKTMPLIRYIYKDYPKLIEGLENRHLLYNTTLKRIHDWEAEGKCFVIRPQMPVTVRRIEKDDSKLYDLYKTGWHDAKNSYDAMMQYLID